MMAKRGHRAHKPRSRNGKDNLEKPHSPGRTPKKNTTKAEKVENNKNQSTRNNQEKLKSSEKKVEPRFLPAGVELASLDNLNKKNSGKEQPAKNKSENSIRRAVKKLTDDTPDGETYNFEVSEQNSVVNEVDNKQNDSNQPLPQNSNPQVTPLQKAVQKMTEETPEEEKVNFVISEQSPVVKDIPKEPSVKSAELIDPGIVKQKKPTAPEVMPIPLGTERSQLELPHVPAPQKGDGRTCFPLAADRIDADLIGRTGMYCERAPLDKERKHSFDWLALNRHNYQESQKSLSTNLGNALYDIGVKKELLLETIKILVIDKQVTEKESTIIMAKVSSYKSRTIPLSTAAWMLKECCKSYQ